jgi:hypothetical protein
MPPDNSLAIPAAADATVAPQPFRFSLRQLLLFIAIAGVLLAAGRMLIQFANAIVGPALPHAIVGQLREGMRKDEVEAILGPPTYKRDDCWDYDPWWNPGWVEFYFENGRLVDLNDESAFPNEFGRATIQPASRPSRMGRSSATTRQSITTIRMGSHSAANPSL